MKLLKDVVKRRDPWADALYTSVPIRRGNPFGLNQAYWRTCDICEWNSRRTLEYYEVRHHSECVFYNPENEVEEYGEVT